MRSQRRRPVRPRELTLRGFRSYAEETVFRWEDRGLVGIVGPIGSGKSSILDGIAFALYGKTPRIESNTKSLINQRRDSMHVALVFDVEGETWRVVRSLRRGGAAAHALYRRGRDGETEVADRAREVTERIETLLGLEFDAFRRSVLLAQNQFAGFLEATGTTRNQVLKGVFGFERLDEMRAIAKNRLDRLSGRLAVLADRRKSAETDRGELAELRRDLEAAEARSQALEALRQPLADLDDLIGRSDKAAADAKDRLGRLDSVADRIPGKEATDSMFATARAAKADVVDAEATLQEAAEARIAAEKERDGLLEPIGGRAGLAAAGDLVAAGAAARRSHEEAVARRSEAEAVASRAQERTAAADRMLAAAEAAVAEHGKELSAVGETATQARAALESARSRHSAHLLRGSLVAGEECPVCRQTVTTIPAADPDGQSFDEATVAAERAEEALEGARGTASRLRADLAAANAEAEASRAAAADAKSAVERSIAEEDELAAKVLALEVEGRERLGEGEMAKRLAELRTAVEKADEAVANRTEAEVAAREAAETALRTAAASEAALGGLRADLATLAGLLGQEVEVGESPNALADALDQLRGAWIEQRAAADEACRRAGEEAEASRLARRDLLEGAGLSEADDIVDVMDAARAEVTRLAATVEVLEKRLDDLEKLAADEEDLVASSEMLRRIHGDLAPSRFLEFVLAERRRLLGDLASDHLEFLSAGRYRFDDSGEFALVDLNAADSVRAASSLSGGESFLASLALALALAEIVAREGGRLDAFFLDEGFGSLDPEHLDLAMEGIERLVTARPDRLVVVVSHVAEMRDRIEDLVILDRDAITGDTLVVAGAAP